MLQQEWPGERPSIPADTDGNIYVVMGAARKAMRRLYPGGYGTEAADRMTAEVQETHSYDEALQVVMSYVDFD